MPSLCPQKTSTTQFQSKKPKRSPENIFYIDIDREVLTSKHGFSPISMEKDLVQNQQQLENKLKQNTLGSKRIEPMTQNTVNNSTIKTSTIFQMLSRMTNHYISNFKLQQFQKETKPQTSVATTKTPGNKTTPRAVFTKNCAQSRITSVRDMTAADKNPSENKSPLIRTDHAVNLQ